MYSRTQRLLSTARAEGSLRELSAQDREVGCESVVFEITGSTNQGLTHPLRSDDDAIPVAISPRLGVHGRNAGHPERERASFLRSYGSRRNRLPSQLLVSASSRPPACLAIRRRQLAVAEKRERVAVAVSVLRRGTTACRGGPTTRLGTESQ